ncbi:MAG: LOG family protein [Phycisphaerales bacterium]|nr:LOG family protein [Phycisphaerales bacterium]
MTTPHPFFGGVRNVSLADEDAVKEIVATTVMNLWEAVDTLTRLRPSRSERYRVAIFGSARAKPDTFVYNEVKRAAAALTEMGCDIVTGGGPGLMQAANEGAASLGKGNHSTGIRVELPFEQEVNPFVEQVFRHKTFFSRLHHFVISADAFVVAPGGIGTVLETLLIWQLLQVRHVEHIPLILVGPMWKTLVEWARQSMLEDADLRMANDMDLCIPRCLDSADEAIAIIREEHARWLERQPARPQHH